MAPPTGQHSTSRYAAAANIIAITEQLTSPAINAVLDPTTGASLEYWHLVTGDTTDIWRTSFVNELGRRANGVGTRMPTGSNTLGFIPKSKVPTGKIPTYGRLVCDIKTNKTETHNTLH